MVRHVPTREPGWSVPIARVYGIPVRLHASFLLLPALVTLASWSHGQPAAPALGFLGLVVVCIVLHELGHAWMAVRTGIRAERVTLYPTGGIAWFEEIPSPSVEWRIAVAGPIVNLAIAASLAGILLLGRGPAGLALSATGEMTVWGLIAALFWINLSLAAFNLVPAYPMDGGRILRSVLGLHWSHRRATVVAAVIGALLAIGLALYGWSNRSVWHAALAMVVFVGAVKQSRAEQPGQTSLERWAEEAIVTGFATLDPDQPLEEAAARAAETAQQDFPVVDRDGRIQGVLTRIALYHGLEFRGPSARVRDEVVSDVSRVGPGEDLHAVLTLGRARSGLPILVVDEGRVVGMIPADRIREFAELGALHT